tara:strand:+ start:565 stop:720 length:156 start_codon:yes stop_codon:yes gene_type:complete
MIMSKSPLRKYTDELKNPKATQKSIKPYLKDYLKSIRKKRSGGQVKAEGYD